MRYKVLVAAWAAIAVVGCSPEARQSYDQAGESMGQAAQKVGDAVSVDAAKAGEKIKERAARAENNTDANIDGGSMTGRVKSALIAAEGVDAEYIDVDSAGNTVTLKGSVSTDAERARAEEIAKQEAGSDWIVNNELRVVSSATSPGSIR